MSHQYVFENGLFQLSGETSCLFTKLIWSVIERVHVVDSSCFSWRYEWSLHFGIGGPRFFPMVAITMISKRFYEIWYKSVLLNVIENMKQRWLVFCLSLLFTQIVKGPWRSGGWNQKKLRNRLLVIFFDFTWFYMITFHLFSVLCQRRYCCLNFESELTTWKIVTIM